MEVNPNKNSTIEFMSRLSPEELDQYATQLIKPHIYRFTCACKIASMRIERFGKELGKFKDIL